MTRARTELTLALAAAAVVIVFLVWTNQRRNVRVLEPVVSVTETQVTNTTVPTVSDTTVLVGPLPGVAHEPPAPERESEQLARDRAYIADAFPALSSWSVATLKSLLATAALNASTDVELADVMQTLGARLGNLLDFEQPQPVEGHETIEYGAMSAELQPYRFMARYEGGVAEVTLVLERQQDRTAVYSFDIHIPD